MSASQPLNGRVAAEPAKTEELFPQVHVDLKQVEARLRSAIHSNVPVVPEVYLHSVHAGGKRVRPALALLAGRLVGELCEATFDVAVAVEMIHLASLIHDDVIDNGGRRRARLTANRVWGNKTAVLVADYIHSVAYRLLSRRCGVEIVERLAETVVQMVEGEFNQMFNEGSLQVDEPLYFQMIQDKTASLMGLSAELGARVSGGESEQAERLYEYGLKLGAAFQIVDDLLDLTGDEERLGKPVGNDLRCGRVTLPLLHVLNLGDAGLRESLLPLICRDEIGAPELGAIQDVLRRGGGLAYAADYACRLSLEACELLQDFPAGESRDALEALALYVVGRTQ